MNKFKMSYKDHIQRDPKIMLGKPIVKGTQITVELIMRKFADGTTIDDLLESCPHLNRTQILAAFEYAADMIANEVMIEAA